METEIGVFILPGFHGCLFQKQKFQIAHVVFWIIGRFLHDIFIDIFCHGRIGNSKPTQEVMNLVIAGIVVMNLQIEKRIEPELDAAVKAHGPGQQDGIFIHSLFFHISFAIFVREHFHIESPALGITSVVEKITGGIDMVLLLMELIIDSLIEMSGPAFVGERSI